MHSYSLGNAQDIVKVLKEMPKIIDIVLSQMP